MVVAQEPPPDPLPAVAESVPLVKERFAPIVKAPTEPLGKMYGILEERFVMARLVVVALVVVELDARKFVRVEEARDRKPFWKEMVVEVAFSPVPRVVHGKANEPLVGQLVLHVSPVRQRVVAAKVVEVAFVVVPFVAKKF